VILVTGATGNVGAEVLRAPTARDGRCAPSYAMPPGATCRPRSRWSRETSTIPAEAAVRDSGVPWTILRAYALMSNTLRWTEQLQQGDTVSEPFADVPSAMVDPFDIGEVAARALTSDAGEGTTHLVSGSEAIVPADRVRILGQVLHRDLRLHAQSNDEAREQMRSSMPEEYVDALFDFYVDGSLDEWQPQSTVRDVLGRPPRTFEERAREHASAFS
jgi:uncharacterized protein YbjT (DUF2867 family)